MDLTLDLTEAHNARVWPMLTAEQQAERHRAYQRRYRAHKRGDHSLCDPARRCAAVEAVVQAETAGEPVPARGVRAQALWDEMSTLTLGPMERVLLDEACACMDRLDRLHRSTDTAAAVEARHQAAALKGLLTEIRRGARDPVRGRSDRRPAAVPDDAAEGSQPGERRGFGDLTIDFATRLSRRRAEALRQQDGPVQHTPDPDERHTS